MAVTFTERRIEGLIEIVARVGSEIVAAINHQTGAARWTVTHAGNPRPTYTRHRPRRLAEEAVRSARAA